MRHLCPTAPDTLRVFPFKDSDPFVIADKDLNLDDQDEKAINTEVPHVYFTANAPKYSYKLVKEDQHFVKVITIPDYSRTQSIVLLDLETLQSYEVSFGEPRKQEEVEVLLESG